VSANRWLAILRAALALSFREGLVASDLAWRRVEPFRKVDRVSPHFPSADDCIRLINACSGSFKDLVRAALLSGCRYSELARLETRDFNREAGTLLVRESKSGKPRHIVLSAEGRELFEQLCAGRPGTALILTRSGDGDGRAPALGTPHANLRRCSPPASGPGLPGGAFTTFATRMPRNWQWRAFRCKWCPHNLATATPG
jgi:integrase